MSSRVCRDFWLCITAGQFNDFLTALDRDNCRYEVMSSIHTPFITYVEQRTGRALMKFSSSSNQYYIRRDAVYKQTT